MPNEGKKGLSGYHRAPEVSMEHEDRVLMILAVAAGKLTVKEAAERTGLSKKQVRSLMNRGLAAMIEAIEPHSPGRPAKPTRVRRLEEEVEELRRDNRRLEEQVKTAERVLEAASGMLRIRAKPGRQKRQSSKATTPAEPKDEEPDGTVDLLDGANVMRQYGARATICASVAGVSPATLRRWRRRASLGASPRSHRAARPCGRDPAVAARVGALVRRFHGLIGADALRHSVAGISRRQALAIKRRTLTDMERERLAAADRVLVTVPGIIRGFDAMHVETTAGAEYLLVAADSAVPFRTSLRRSERYDGLAVAETLERDFHDHGAPYVLRFDRARQHATAEVRDLLARFGVLVLQGPPHHPGFYGQLERQNREHRAWLRIAGVLDPDALDAETELMLRRFNYDLPRRMLGFRTAAHAWFSRPNLALDRRRLRADVDALAARIAPSVASKDLAERFAIQATLAHHGLVRIEKGAPALPDFSSH
jgi:predicted ArsR family transcriptional regulator